MCLYDKKMKKMLILFILFMVGILTNLQSQEINWRNLSDEYSQLGSTFTGLDFGVVYGLSYGFPLQTELPIFLNAEVSFPFGSTLFDDWKMKINGHGEIWKNKNLSFNVKTGLIIRRLNSELSRLYNFSGDISILFGYYKPQWFVAGELNWDKSIISHIHHSRVIKNTSPNIKDSWLKGLGGNIKYALVGNYSFSKIWGVFLNIGWVQGQDFVDEPDLPIFGKLTFQRAFH